MYIGERIKKASSTHTNEIKNDNDL